MGAGAFSNSRGLVDTPAISKMLRLREHIHWAADHGCLTEVYDFLRALPESDWHHVGD